MSRDEADRRIREALKSRAYDGIQITWGWAGAWRVAHYSMCRDGSRVGSSTIGLTRSRVARAVEQIYCYDD